MAQRARLEDAGGKRLAPFYVDLEQPGAGRAAFRSPGHLRVHLKDDHLQYAITWFGLAAAVVIAFRVWRRAQRRAQFLLR